MAQPQPQPSTMSWKEEMQKIADQVLTKLQGLPEADPLEIGAFTILLIFIATVLIMFILACIHCCCCSGPQHRVSRVKPFHQP
ncbi:small integral membrane protein 5-like [Acipenser oxyrinchus oxyrinchus]|uniref:Small integral membrane protein 5-like n=1 Tax=Acipenser oxyrinchus oxyrinchus TaxID=40147 RepID=A0AAD8G159_ACIOX|nr:small integral membrane protein 5-like [Acipenser oxyrinchus oxyrinchus]